MISYEWNQGDKFDASENLKRGLWGNLYDGSLTNGDVSTSLASKGSANRLFGNLATLKHAPEFTSTMKEQLDQVGLNKAMRRQLGIKRRDVKWFARDLQQAEYDRTGGEYGSEWADDNRYARRVNRARNRILGNLKGEIYNMNVKDIYGNKQVVEAGTGVNGNFIADRFGMKDKNGNSAGLNTIAVTGNSENLNQARARESKNNALNDIRNTLWKNADKKASDQANLQMSQYLSTMGVGSKAWTDEKKQLVTNRLLNDLGATSNPYHKNAIINALAKIDSNYKDTPLVSDQERANFIKGQVAQSQDNWWGDDNSKILNSMFADKYENINGIYQPKNQSWEPILAKNGAKLDGWHPMKFLIGGVINKFAAGGSTSQAAQIGAIAQVYGKRIAESYKKQGKTLSEDQMQKAVLQGTAQLIQASQSQDPQQSKQAQEQMASMQEEVAQVLQSGNSEQLAKIGEAVMQSAQTSQQQQAAYSKLGSKIKYIDNLKNECPEGQEVVYFRKNGGICKKCQAKQKMQQGNTINAKITSNQRVNLSTREPRETQKIQKTRK